MKESKDKLKVIRKVDRKGNESYIIGNTTFKVERVTNENSSNDLKTLVNIYLKEHTRINSICKIIIHTGRFV